MRSTVPRFSYRYDADGVPCRASAEHNGCVIHAHTAAQVRAAEEPLLAAETGFAGSLMERAAFALAVRCARLLRDRRGRLRGAVVVALVGTGNNGGDALHALAYLARRGVRTTAFLATDGAHDGGLEALRRAGGRVEAAAVADLPGRVWRADLVLDALTGIGSTGALRGAAADIVTALASTDPRSAQPASLVRHARVVAVDVPSGIGVDDGALPGAVLRADHTVTFGAIKPGLVLPPASERAGKVHLVDLDLPFAPLEAPVRRLTAADVAALWPVPAAPDHKYSRGVAGIVAGSVTYPGAAVLTVAGAARAGVGMIRFDGAPEAARTVLAARPEVVTAPGRVQAWVVGPGTSADDDGARVAEALGRAFAQRVPVVVDAGALPVLARVLEPLPPSVVLTPHAGELAGILAARGRAVTRAEVEAEPLRWARTAHELTGVTVLLKGAVTVVVGPRGAYAQAEAPPWLATAGAGDVLAGVLGALLAGRSEQVAVDPDLPARLAAAAASVCGRAAHLANPGGPVTAHDVADALPGVVAALLRRNA